MFRIRLIGVVFCLIFIAFAQLSAQESTPDVRTTPTKTPTPSASATRESNPNAVFEPLTQADLTILTGNVQRPNGIYWFDNNLYTACTGDSTIYEINSESGATITYIYGIGNAHTMYAETRNNLLTMWIPDYADNTLKLVTPQGVQRVVDDLQGPWGISYVDEESFFVTNLLGNNVSRVTRSGENTVVLDGLSSPTGIAHDGENVFIANNGSSRRAIEWFPLETLASSETTATIPEDHVLVSGLQNTTGIQLAADGNLYFAYSLANRGVVGRVNPQTCMANGGCTNADVEIVVYTELTAPLAGLAISPDMRLFVHTMFSPDLYWARIEG